MVFIRAIQKNVAKFEQRDFDYTTDDNFEVAISPFNDKRTGYLFVINPLGARADLLLSGKEDTNIDWNGVWDTKTTITAAGWFAVIRIPFNTLQFRKENTNSWAVNFERNIRCKNEQDRWQGWSRDFGVESIAVAGTLTGAGLINWVISDMLVFQSDRQYDLWHDRAAFHFLTKKKNSYYTSTKFADISLPVDTSF
jgi:hypothetical protein